MEILTMPNTFETCPMDDFHHIFDKVSSEDGDELLAMTAVLYFNITCVASLIVSLPAMIYGIFCCLKERTLTLHFVGLARPKKLSKAHSTESLALFPNIDTSDTLLTIQTPLKPTDTVADLKQLIKATYDIPATNDVVIFFAHHMLTDDARTLSYYRIAEHSLFTLAVCDKEKVIVPEHYAEPEDIHALPMPQYETENEPVQDVNSLFGMYESDSDSDDEETIAELSANKTNEPEEKETPTWPRLGFDCVTQMEDMLVHRMPICGHEMNHESLMGLALSTLNDPNNLYVRCPHRCRGHAWNSREQPCNVEWPYAAILDILRYKDERPVDTTQTDADKITRGTPASVPAPDNLIGHVEDDIEEEINADALNAMFTTDSDDEDSDSEEESSCEAPGLFGSITDDEDSSDDEDELADALEAIDHMFDDDEEVEEAGLRKTLNGLWSSMSGFHLDVMRYKTDLVKVVGNTVEKAASTRTSLAKVASKLKAQPKPEAKAEWKDLAKLELLAARNLIQKKCDVQKCPRCKSLFYRNADDSRMPFEHITTIEHIEREFKFHCVFCKADTEEVVKTVPYVRTEEEEIRAAEARAGGPHREDEIEEDIDAEALNAMFGHESDDEDDDEEDELAGALHAIEHMFDDDEPEFEEVVVQKALNGLCWCCGAEWTDGHFCDEAFKRDLCAILSAAETKRIGQVDDVPSMRACPECCQLIFHTDACKHMRCGSCKCDFCFVCLGVRDKQKGWSCGSYCDACPVQPRQTMATLPDTIVVTRRTFKLYE